MSAETTDRVAPQCEVHDECDACGWCPCWESDPTGNRPRVPFPHRFWHAAVAEGTVR